MERNWIISSDSHLLEPEDLFEKALIKKYGDATPRYVNEHLGNKVKHYFTGLEYICVDEIVEGDDSSAESQQLQNELLEASWDSAKRVACLDKDGVWAEVLNSTWMLYTMRAKDDKLVQDCCEVYNDWTHELVSYDTNRLKATAMIHMADLDWALKELERVAKLGHCGVLINCDARPEWAPYRDPKYDPFWARLEEMGMPLMLHIITGNVQDPFTLYGKDREDIVRLTLDIFAEGPVTLANEFMFGGIMDRFPNLKLVLGEYEVSWLPNFIWRMNQFKEQLGPAMGFAPLKHDIDWYFDRVWHGFVDDPLVKIAVDVLGSSKIMWGSDFPHARCTYPNSQKIVENVLSDFGAEAKADMSFYNAARLYNIDGLPAQRLIAAE
jgi:predicted TIM-barrel fold metal-dependent hydrolase